MVEVRGVVLHIAEGSYEGTIAWQKNPNADVSSHFIAAKNGDAAQMVDTGTTAWTQKAGNGHWLSIENEGFVPDKLTSGQLEFAAQILARAHDVYKVPLQVTNDPNGKGLGHHSMGANPGSPNDWGHSQCPGSNIINQKSAIVARAKEIVEGDMPLSDEDIEKVASKTLDTFLKKQLEVPDIWMALWPDDPGIQDGAIGLMTLWRSGYFHARQANEELTGGPEELRDPSKLDEILAILTRGLPVPGQVNLTPEAVAAIADELHRRLEQ